MSAVFFVSTLLLAHFVHRRLLGHFGVGTLQHVVRLPGNLLHELAHAIAMLATGYTITGFTVSILDRQGRGHVKPGRAWIGLARPWLTNFVSPVAPAFAALLVLPALHAWSGAPGLPTSLSGFKAVLLQVPWQTWQLWVGLVLAFSVTAEMAPSDVDLAAWWRPALVVAVLAAASAWALEHFAPGRALSSLAWADAAARSTTGRALAMAVWSLPVVGPIAWTVGRIRAA